VHEFERSQAADVEEADLDTLEEADEAAFREQAEGSTAQEGGASESASESIKASEEHTEDSESQTAGAKAEADAAESTNEQTEDGEAQTAGANTEADAAESSEEQVEDGEAALLEADAKAGAADVAEAHADASAGADEAAGEAVAEASVKHAGRKAGRKAGKAGREAAKAGKDGKKAGRRGGRRAAGKAGKRREAERKAKGETKGGAKHKAKRDAKHDAKHNAKHKDKAEKKGKGDKKHKAGGKQKKVVDSSLLQIQAVGGSARHQGSSKLEKHMARDEGSSKPEETPKHGADYNYQVSDFQMAGSRTGYLNFINKYPCTRSPGPQGFPNKFDWIIHRKWELDNVSKGPDPYAVFSSMEIHSVPAMLKVLETNWPHSNKSRVAYFTGDMMLSKVEKNFGKGTLSRLRKAFPGGIWWQAYDVRKPGFKVAPDGLNGMYLLPVWDVAEKAIGSATLEGKTKGVLAAWGKFHPNLDAMIPARTKLKQWVGTPESIAAGVEHASFEPREYWSTLAKYRFTISPRGGGIQSPKNDEALLVLTIPISTREGSVKGFKTEPAFDDLKKLGWPMVVLDEWSEITKPKLDEWWDELSPRLVSFRKNCLTTEGFWRIITGQVTYCE